MPKWGHNSSMPEASDPAFVLNCPDCDLNREFDELSDASRFYTKHREHTGHEPEWERANLGVDITENTQWNVFCDKCAKTWEFNSKSEAETFTEEHATYTDHQATGITTEDRTRISGNNLKELIGEFETATADGMPEGFIYAFTSDLELSDSQINTKLDELKQKGEIYEPSTGHLRTT